MTIFHSYVNHSFSTLDSRSAVFGVELASAAAHPVCVLASSVLVDCFSKNNFAEGVALLEKFSVASALVTWRLLEVLGGSFSTAS